MLNEHIHGKIEHSTLLFIQKDRKMRMSDLQPKVKIDYILIFIIIMLCLASLFSLITLTPVLPEKYASINFPLRQLLYYIIGSFLIVLVMLVDYDRFKKMTWFIYGIGMIPLFMIFFNFPGFLIETYNGIARGIKLPLINIQPAEYFKIILTLTLAHVISEHNEKFIDRTAKTDLRLLLKIAAVSIVPMGLIASQPDLGSTLVLTAIVASMVLVSGIQWRLLFMVLISGLMGVGSVFLAWFLFPNSVGEFLRESVFKHVEGRFYGWLYPEQFLASGHQLIRTMRAIGSGQLFGKGMGNMQVDVPERHTDMIYTAISEQFGFLGSTFVLILLFLFIYRLLHIALKSNDQYGSFIITGFIGLFAFQTFQNVGMSIQLLPITGVPLPFISFGGSSILSYMVAVGIVLNIHSRTRTYMFE